MNNRLWHVDFLKGFAIFLMVMGHCLSGSINHLDIDNYKYIWFIGSVIYTFHMPLLFFLSGYIVAHQQIKNNVVSQKIWITIKKKSQTLLLPALSFMCINHLMYGGWSLAWFLMAMFWASIVFVIVQKIANVLKWNLGGEIFIHFLMFCILFVATHFITKTWINDMFVFHKAMKFYPFYVIGYMIKKTGWNERYILKSWMLTICIIGYVVLLWLTSNMIQDTHEILWYPRALCAIGVCYYICRTINVNKHQWLLKNCITMGQCSLAIYMLSGYFLITLPCIGNLFAMAETWSMGYITPIMFQLLIPLPITAICCWACVVAYRILSQSKLFNLILFGKRE